MLEVGGALMSIVRICRIMEAWRRRNVLILLNNNLQEYGGLEMRLGLPPNVIDSITFRGSVNFYYTYRQLYYHTSVAICRLIA